jgi:hypothetical protein
MLEIVLGLSLVLASSPAWAATVAAPGPDIGAGIPALALVAGAALIAGAALFLKRLRK